MRKGLIAKTPRVTSCAGAAGVGSVFGMVRVYPKSMFSEMAGGIRVGIADKLNYFIALLARLLCILRKCYRGRTSKSTPE